MTLLTWKCTIAFLLPTLAAVTCPRDLHRGLRIGKTGFAAPGRWRRRRTPMCAFGTWMMRLGVRFDASWGARRGIAAAEGWAGHGGEEAGRGCPVGDVGFDVAPLLEIMGMTLKRGEIPCASSPCTDI